MTIFYGARDNQEQSVLTLDEISHRIVTTYHKVCENAAATNNTGHFLYRHAAVERKDEICQRFVRHMTSIILLVWLPDSYTHQLFIVWSQHDWRHGCTMYSLYSHNQMVEGFNRYVKQWRTFKWFRRDLTQSVLLFRTPAHFWRFHSQIKCTWPAWKWKKKKINGNGKSVSEWVKQSLPETVPLTRSSSL